LPRARERVRRIDNRALFELPGLLQRILAGAGRARAGQARALPPIAAARSPALAAGQSPACP
jgi:hypothetical protein